MRGSNHVKRKIDLFGLTLFQDEVEDDGHRRFGLVGPARRSELFWLQVRQTLQLFDLASVVREQRREFSDVEGSQQTLEERRAPFRDVAASEPVEGGQVKPGP